MSITCLQSLNLWLFRKPEARGICKCNSMVPRSIFDINTTSDISKLSVISRAAKSGNFEISIAVFMTNTSKKL